MAFLQEELRNLSFKSVVAGILGTRNRSTAPDNGTYYEEIATSALSINPNQILSNIANVPVANNISEADNAATLNPLLIKAYNSANAIHLSPLPGNKAFFATETFGDLGTRITNLIMPQMVPKPDGHPSLGYTIRLYNGNPASGGTEITTTAEQSGADVGWVASYGPGAIITASSFTSITDPNDVWITAYQYIGPTGGSSTAGGVAYSTQFTQADLSSGYLTVVHNLEALYKVCNVTIMDENNNEIEPDGIVFNTSNILTIDMRMLETITGTWSLVVNTYSEADVVPPVAPVTNNYINGAYINRRQIN